MPVRTATANKRLALASRLDLAPWAWRTTALHNTRMDLDFGTLSRRQLQTLCKQFKIPANATNVAMAAALRDLADGGCAIPIADVMSTPSKPAATTPGRVTRSQLKKQHQAGESSRLEVQGQKLFAGSQSTRRLPSRRRRMTAEEDNEADNPEGAFRQQDRPGKAYGAQVCDHVVQKYADIELKQIGMERDGVTDDDSVVDNKYADSGEKVSVHQDEVWKEEKVPEENNQNDAPLVLENDTEKQVELVRPGRDEVLQAVENVQKLVEDVIDAEKEVKQIGSERCGVAEEPENVQKLVEQNIGNISPESTLVVTFDHERPVSVDIGTKGAKVTEEAENVQSMIEPDKAVMEDDVQDLGEDNQEMWSQNQGVNLTPMAHNPTEVEQLSSALSLVSLQESSASASNLKKLAKGDKENFQIGFERFSLRQLKKFQKEIYQKKEKDKMMRPRKLEPLSAHVHNN